MSAKSYSPSANVHMTKKCPYCYAYLPLTVRRCHACKKRVGDVDKLGFASKPFDWLGYLIAILAAAALCIFVWWGFFKE